jgi:hypothetical protein
MYGVGQSPPQRRGWLVIIGVLLLVLVVLGLFFAFYTVVLKKDGESPAPEVTLTMVQVVSPAGTAAPSATVPPPTDTATPTRIPTSTPTDTPMPTPTLRPPPEAITIGVRARVNISEGLALNLRDLPTLSGSTVITRLVAETQVDVFDGPEDVGDMRWWNVNGGTGRVGWVVEAFGGETWLVPVGWTDQLPPLSTALPVVTPTATVTPTLAPVATATLEVTPEATPVLTPTVAPEVTPEATPVLTPTVAPEVTPEATPVLTPTATPEGGIPSPTVGGRAQVTTRYQFVNLRPEPGLGKEPIGQLQNGTIVTILEGPEEADGFRWWKVDDGQGNIGWAAERVAGEVLLTPLP